MTGLDARLRSRTATTAGSRCGATGLLRDLQPWPTCSTRPTSTSPAGSARCSARTDEQVLLAAALAVRAVRAGIDLRRPRHRRRPAARGRRRPLPWPDARGLAGDGRSAARWSASEVLRAGRRTCSTSTATGARRGRSATTWSPGSRRPAPEVDARRARRRRAAGLPAGGYDEQRDARRVPRPARWTTVLTGGPGTGKTTTVAGLLALLAEQARARRPAAPAAADRAARPDRQGVGPAPGGGRAEATRKLPARPTRRGSAGCRPRPCTGCSAGGPTAAPGSGTTAATGCPTTWSWSTRPRWCR